MAADTHSGVAATAPDDLGHYMEATGRLRRELNEALDALRYIAGFDVAGYESHLEGDVVARNFLRNRGEPVR